jgi:hypothetical protein
MDCDCHRVSAFIDHDDAPQGLQDRSPSGPTRDDLAEPIGSLGAVIADRAIDEFDDQLAIVGLDSVPQIGHPLQARCEARSQRVGKVFSGQLAFEGCNQIDQSLLVERRRWLLGQRELATRPGAALGGQAGDDLLQLLRTWSIDHGGVDPGSHLKNSGVPVGFWSHVGD